MSLDSTASTSLLMPTHTVFPIEQPISPSQLAAYTALRLASLRIDPHAFLSTYAREVAFPEDVWRQRFDLPSTQTFVASVLDDAGGMDEWIGSASIAGPSQMMRTPSIIAPLKEAGVGANWETYGLHGMWVHPAHRGKGVGAELVNACLEWARTNVDTKFSSESSGDVEKVVVLLVYDNNVAGRALYSRTGFTDLEGVVALEEGQRWMWVKV